MKADKNDKLKQLLKQAGTDQPAEGFTKAVMNIIEAEAVQEATIKSLLKQHPVEGPSFEFTASVMRQIPTEHKPLIIQPIITKNAWYAITAVFTLMIVASFAISGTGKLDEVEGNNRISSIIDQLQAVPATYVMGVVAVAILLWGDYLIMQRKKAALN